MTKKINIRPTTGVYATYKNINYQIWNAIAEFVDNSTQSYFNNKEKLENTKYWKELRIGINYIEDTNGDYYLEIRDNAFGMDFHDFKRAIILDSRPNQVGRSEFGMGLKTAACWFGGKWSVESTMLGSTVRYKTTVDVELLSKYKNEEIEVEETSSRTDEHGTVIRIWDLHRTIRGRQVSKTKNTLSGIYRQDIMSDNIAIYYNNERLAYEYPEFYIEDIDGVQKEWKKDVDFEVDFEDKKYYVNGIIGIRKTARVKEAGFSLFRNGRAIIGGYEDNYRPSEVLGESNSYEFQRMFGDLNLDGWPVVQTKDNFYWNNGLEEKFVEKLVEVTKDYVAKARVIRKRPKISIEELSGDVGSDLNKSGIIEELVVRDYIQKEIIENDQLNEKVAYTEEIEQSMVEPVSEKTVSKHGKAYTFKHMNIEYTFNLIFEENDPTANWLDIMSENNLNEYSIVWNIKHRYFKTLDEMPLFIDVMSNFIFSMALAEISSSRTSTDGKILPNSIRTHMNDTLNTILRGEISDAK